MTLYILVVVDTPIVDLHFIYYIYLDVYFVDILMCLGHGFADYVACSCVVRLFNLSGNLKIIHPSCRAVLLPYFIDFVVLNIIGF